MMKTTKSQQIKEEHSRKGQLRFSTKPDEIHYGKDRIPLTQEEVGSLWYTKDEERRMRNEAKILAAKLRFISERSFLSNTFPCNDVKNAECQHLEFFYPLFLID